MEGLENVPDDVIQRAIETALKKIIKDATKTDKNGGPTRSEYLLSRCYRQLVTAREKLPEQATCMLQKILSFNKFELLFFFILFITTLTLVLYACMFYTLIFEENFDHDPF